MISGKIREQKKYIKREVAGLRIKKTGTCLYYKVYYEQQGAE